eukprot:CAMPEP_0174274212 /NCGR_PEP_ID=MMETSP0439-20130205/57243_1 /TAXON_ID=0 /ORGANISM="Stereomyxa ramosa, Strain Chinc5" /LENGTH=255 /DNA_ID=CAMNT_0015365841 /DNA_START=51 /DNA_END=815 /DNA_ORIENTATION=+
MQEYFALYKSLIDTVVRDFKGNNQNVTRTTPVIVAEIIQMDKEILQRTNLLRTHQGMQEKIKNLQLQIKQKEDTTLLLAEKLKKLEFVLLQFLTTTKKKMYHQPRNKVSASTLVGYARKISYTTAAPPGWNPTVQLQNFFPPFPTEEQIRTGAVYHHKLPDFSSGTKVEMEPDKAAPTFEEKPKETEKQLDAITQLLLGTEDMEYTPEPMDLGLPAAGLNISIDPIVSASSESESGSSSESDDSEQDDEDDDIEW